MKFLQACSLWISAAILVMIPIFLSFDFGGIYHWSQYVAAIGILIASVFAIVGLTDSTASSGLAQHRLLIPLGLLVGWAWFQSLQLSPGLVAWISPGAYDAYAQWLGDLLANTNDAGTLAVDRFSISVSPTDTTHVAAVLTMLLPLGLAASLVFHSRSRLQMLLSAIAIAGASVAILGFYRKLDPTADLWIFKPRATSFGGFVNRNNAALMLNFGLAASLGLLSWRMMALHSIELDDPDFEFNDLFALISDRESLTGLLGGAACTAGLLVNGSRGGFVAALFGLVMAFGYVRPRRGLLSIPILLCVLAVSVAVLITPMQLNLESLQRFEFFSSSADTLQSDGRLDHWQDGWNAALAYFPGGAGVSSYAYAYLPHQQQSAGAWFEHADNLWLEMLVETGLVGLIVFVLLIGIVLISVNRLALSVDPLDQGIRVACWYSLTAILVSQFFDYGLAMPSNLVVAVLLGSAVVSRDYANGGPAAVLSLPSQEEPFYFVEGEDEFGDESLDDQAGADEWYDDQGDSANEAIASTSPSRGERTPRTKIRSSNWYSASILSTTALSMACSLAGLMVLPSLKEDALSDSMLTRLRDEYSNWSMIPESLEKMEEALQQRAEVRPNPLLFQRIATVQKDRGRLSEAMEWKPQTEEELRNYFQETDLVNRSLPYPPQGSDRYRGAPRSHGHYQDAWRTSVVSLTHCPLGQTPRGDLLRLKPLVFHDGIKSKSVSGADGSSEAGTSEEIANIAVEQLLTFYAGNPQRLMTLGTESLNRQDIHRAESAFRLALKANPQSATQVMRLLREHPEANVSNAIPDESTAMRLAAAQYLSWPNPDPKFLRHCLKFVRCGEGATLQQRANCEALTGRIHFYLEAPEEGKSHFRRAIQLAPDVASYRIELIEYLLNLGLDKEKNEAMAQARLGRKSIPDDNRFQQFIDKNAESDRQRLVDPGNAPQVDPELMKEILQ